MTELKPCPFCGNEATHTFDFHERMIDPPSKTKWINGSVDVGCPICGFWRSSDFRIKAPLTIEDFVTTYETAVGMWNKRSDNHKSIVKEGKEGWSIFK